MYENEIQIAKDHFAKLIESQFHRIENMQQSQQTIDPFKKKTHKIGICPGDGIGPIICKQAEHILRNLLNKEISSGDIEICTISDLTIEKRIEENASIPASVLTEIKSCDVILKGPTTTPRQGDGSPNIESANVAMRKELDLFANIRPISIPSEQIDWVFFRENTEGSYAVGNDGIQIGKKLSIDFTFVTTLGCERIIRAAFEYAKTNHKNHVTAITKANIIKTTDGIFLDTFYKIAKEYPSITADDWYIDIMTAKLLDENRRQDFQVMVLPNLYGDILTDEAAQLQGGVGTGGSANIGHQYAMFEAIHGSAPRMVSEGREKYANPSSIIRATSMLLRHLGYTDQSDSLDAALNSVLSNSTYIITGHENGATAEEFTHEVIKRISKVNTIP